MRGAFGGFEGRALRQGDRLPVGRPALAATEALSIGCGLLPPSLAMPLQLDGYPAVRVLPAAEYDDYTQDAHTALWGSLWKITSQSDRYGYRLAGPALLPLAPMEMRSHGIVPGVIQVPPGGQPIVQMRDAQPSGGYPKIGTVIEADLWRLGQAPIGSSMRFMPVTWAQAVEALSVNRRWLSDAQRRLTLWQASAAAAAMQGTS
jgi:allophanate hydrolase subunit 2